MSASSCLPLCRDVAWPTCRVIVYTAVKNRVMVSLLTTTILFWHQEQQWRQNAAAALTFVKVIASPFGMLRILQGISSGSCAAVRQSQNSYPALAIYRLPQPDTGARWFDGVRCTQAQLQAMQGRPPASHLDLRGCGARLLQTVSLLACRRLGGDADRIDWLAAGRQLEPQGVQGSR